MGQVPPKAELGAPTQVGRYKKKQRKDYRTTGKYLPNLKCSRQRAYPKLAAIPDWRERHNAKQRERYHSDPAFRTRKLARQRRLYRAKKFRGLKGKE
jgi:hypothetical protein